MKEELSLKRCLKALEERVSEGNLEATDAYLKVMDRLERPAAPQADQPIDGLMGRVNELERRVTFLETLKNVKVVH